MDKLTAIINNLITSSTVDPHDADGMVITTATVMYLRIGKIEDVATGTLNIKKGDYVFIDTTRGPNYAVVISHPEKRIGKPDDFKKIGKIIAPSEIQKLSKWRDKEVEAIHFCREKAAERQIDMKVIDVEFVSDLNKVIFYFTADGRVDFRELTKDLAKKYKMMIDMRQIGIRDEAKTVGGIGICGHELCCKTFLHTFSPVTIKMAKTQGLVLNPQKVSGLCGRLFCCLSYENEMYEELRKGMPGVNSIVKTKDGKGKIVEIDIFKKSMRVELENGMQNVYLLNDIIVLEEAVETESEEDLKDYIE